MGEGEKQGYVFFSNTYIYTVREKERLSLSSQHVPPHTHMNMIALTLSHIHTLTDALLL